MVFVLKESEARKIFAKYKNVAAFTLGKSKGINDDELEISYTRLSFLPDEDVLNAIADGSMSVKKVIKQAVKDLCKPSLDTSDIGITMASMVNMISPENKGSKKYEKRLRKSGPNILVFVLDDPENGGSKSRNKFMKKYIAALFECFGIEVIDDEKVVKKLFRGKKKKIVERVTNAIHSNKTLRLNDRGHALKKLLFTYYAIELRQSALNGLEIGDLSKSQIKTLLKTLIDTYTNNNLKVAQYAGKKKDIKKVCKRLKKHNKAAVKAYGEFREIMKAVNPELKMPKVEQGYHKKKEKPLMNIDKFVDFFTKKDCRRAGVLVMLYAHTCTHLMGAVPGTAEYTKYMTNAIGTVAGELSEKDGFNSETLSKEYIAAAKAWAKAKPADQ